VPTRLEQRAVLLAASYPPREYKLKADSQEIAAAVKALMGAVFQQGWRLVFGGHPAISPLVLMIAREYGRKQAVVIYQSAFFRNHIPAATAELAHEQFGGLEFVDSDAREPLPIPDEPPDPTKCPLSLLAMRRAMIGHPSIAGLVLIGGDTGLQQEFELFREMRSDLPVIPIAAPGGIASELRDFAYTPGMDDRLRSALAQSRNYSFLFSRIMHYLSIV
jgi:hypothetical protein